MSTKHHAKTWVTLTDALLEMISASGLSWPGLEKATGVQRGSLMRFSDGTQSLRLDKADALMRFFNLRVVEAPPRRRRRTTKRKGG